MLMGSAEASVVLPSSCRNRRRLIEVMLRSLFARE
jgi:hypothetical protein